MTDFQEVYNLYFREVYRYALSLCRSEAMAEEITQETFYKALAKLDSFDGKCKLSVWLCQIAKNQYYDWYSRNKRTIPLDETHISRANEKDFSLDLDDMETARQILQRVHTLDEPYKEVFMLHALGDVPLKDISRLFNKSDSWARVIYYRAKNMIIAKLKEEQI